MAMGNRGVSAYSKVGVETHAAKYDQHQLVALMFEHVLESINIARGAMQQGRVDIKVKAIDKALNIIQVGLRASLDLENGGELAANLAAVYDYCVLRLTQANAKNDEAAFQEVVALIKPIADSWNAIRAGGGGLNADAPVEKPVVDNAPVKTSTTTRRVGSMYSSSLAPMRGALAAGG